MKNFYLLMLLTGIVVSQETLGQAMVVKAIDGSETTESLALVQKLSFSGENLLVLFQGGITETFGLTGLSKIYFTGLPQATGISSVTGSSRLTVYPNPAKDVLNIRNLAGGTYSAVIYRTDGTVAMRATLSSASPLLISDLPKGLYFITISGQAVKFIKL